MNKKQKEDVVKLLYDLVKLTYAGLIVGGIISPNGLHLAHVGVGFIISLLLFSVAYWLGKKEE